MSILESLVGLHIYVLCTEAHSFAGFCCHVKKRGVPVVRPARCPLESLCFSRAGRLVAFSGPRSSSLATTGSALVKYAPLHKKGTADTKKTSHIDEKIESDKAETAACALPFSDTEINVWVDEFGELETHPRRSLRWTDETEEYTISEVTA